MIETGKGRFFSFTNHLSDLVILGLLWMLTALPVVTVGASNAALYHAVAKTFRAGRGRPVSEYIRAWKENLKAGIGTTLIYMILLIFLYIGLEHLGNSLQPALLLQFLLFILLAGSGIYIFPLISRFRLSILQYIQVSLFLALHYPRRTLAMLATGLLSLAVIGIFPFLFPVVLPFYTYYCTFFIEKIFRDFYEQEGDEASCPWYYEISQ